MQPAKIKPVQQVEAKVESQFEEVKASKKVKVTELTLNRMRTSQCSAEVAEENISHGKENLTMNALPDKSIRDFNPFTVKKVRTTPQKGEIDSKKSKSDLADSSLHQSPLQQRRPFGSAQRHLNQK